MFPWLGEMIGSHPWFNWLAIVLLCVATMACIGGGVWLWIKFIKWAVGL